MYTIPSSSECLVLYSPYNDEIVVSVGYDWPSISKTTVESNESYYLYRNLIIYKNFGKNSLSLKQKKKKQTLVCLLIIYPSWPSVRSSFTKNLFYKVYIF